jgi:hypothetical protein
MEHITKNQSYLAAFLLMVSAVVMDQVLSLLPAMLGTSITVFSFLMGMGWICDHSDMPGWPRLSLNRKIAMAGIPAIAVLAISLFR